MVDDYLTQSRRNGERLARLEQRIQGHEEETERRFKEGLEKIDDLRKWGNYWLFILIVITLLGRSSIPPLIQTLITHIP